MSSERAPNPSLFATALVLLLLVGHLVALEEKGGKMVNEILCFVPCRLPLCYYVLFNKLRIQTPFLLSFELLEVFIWGWMDGVYLEVLCIMYE